MAHNRRETRKIELVETGNIALSLSRMKDGHIDLRRALYHALTMSYAVNTDAIRKIREALELP